LRKSNLIKKRLLTLVLATGFSCLFSPSLQAQTPPTYSIYSLGANTTGLSISQNGTYATGLYEGTNTGFSNPQAGFLWTQSGGVVTLPAAGTTNHVDASPNAVNNSGTVAGAVSTTFYGANSLPVLYSNSSSATVLPLPAGSSIGRAYGINNAGTVVGSISQDLNWYATVFTPTNATVLLQTTPDGSILQYAYGIANSGRIAGQFISTNSAVTGAFYLDSGATNAVDLGFLPVPGGSNSTVASGISGSGSYITGSSGPNAFLYQPDTATMTALPLLEGWTGSLAYSVNDLGWVVGVGGDITSVPFLFDGTSTYSLQGLLTGPDSFRWDMINGTGNTALGISDNGIITGRALYDGVTTGFVMVPNSPIPEPSTWALLAVGLLVILGVLRRKKAA